MRAFNLENVKQTPTTVGGGGGGAKTPSERARKPFGSKTLRRQNSSPDKMSYRERNLSTFARSPPSEKNADLVEPPVLSPHRKTFSQPQCSKSKIRTVKTPKPPMETEKVPAPEAVVQVAKPPVVPRGQSTKRPQQRSEVPMSISSMVPSTTAAPSISVQAL